MSVCLWLHRIDRSKNNLFGILIPDIRDLHLQLHRASVHRFIPTERYTVRIHCFGLRVGIKCTCPPPRASTQAAHVGEFLFWKGRVRLHLLAMLVVTLLCSRVEISASLVVTWSWPGSVHCVEMLVKGQRWKCWVPCVMWLFVFFLSLSCNHLYINVCGVCIYIMK